MDEQILERMARIPKSKLRGVPTLFSQPDDAQTFDTTIIDALSHEQNNTRENQVESEEQEFQEHADMNNDEHHDDKYIDLDQNKSPSNQEKKSIDKQDDNDSSEDEEMSQQWNIQSEVEDNDEEDEEATRRALTFMLAEFGDQLE